MPEGSENAEGQKPAVDPLAGTKYEGKTAAEIAAMHEALESKIGAQGEELGTLRGTVEELQRQMPRREPAAKSEYTELGDRLIVDPASALPELEERIVRRTLGQVQRSRTNDEVVRQFFAANPELEDYKEIVSVIGERIFQQNPGKSLAAVLADTKREATAYISDLRKRMGAPDPVKERKRAGVTTGGGSARETAADREEPEVEGDPEQESILKAVQELKSFRKEKIKPPRSR